MADMSRTPSEWDICLSSWIIQDGNYGDFSAGQQAEFALEFDPRYVRFSEGKERSAVLRADPPEGSGFPIYRISGEIIYLSKKVWIVDFGLRAFREAAPPAGLSVGDFVTGELSLGIDPFFYFERLCALPGMPPLIYSWKIDSIRLQTAPFIEEDRMPGGDVNKLGSRLVVSSGTVLCRDESKLGYKTVESTDAWKDDDGRAEYLLTCTRLDIPPKSASSSDGAPRS